MPRQWCTVTVVLPNGRRHSLDLEAESTYDAAHLYVDRAKRQPKLGLPTPNMATVFEVTAKGKTYLVFGDKLQHWIARTRSIARGPTGEAFRARADLKTG